MSKKKSEEKQRPSRFSAFLAGDKDTLFALPKENTAKDIRRDEAVAVHKERQAALRQEDDLFVPHYTHMPAFRRVYPLLAVLCCICLVGLLLITVSRLPEFGEDNPLADAVADRYIEQGVEETGATNFVAGMILDYRAFDTLGESFVLFTALNCVIVLLRRDRGNEYENLPYNDLSNDKILRGSATLLVPAVFTFGIYIMLNGHLSPGGGFAGGAAMGAGLILMSAAFGFDVMNQFFSAKLFNGVAGVALGFYCLSKAYSFFCGANGYETFIPKGIPGAILSGGLILPLNIAVGMVVTMTMFGIYCMFKRGRIGK